MGGTITHLVIADKIIKKLPAGIINNAGMFYAGSLAPDAIHARHGYVRAMKKHTHMRDDIKDRDFQSQKNREIFHARLNAFITSNLHMQGSLLDAYRGYIAHVLSDEVFIMTARQKIVELTAKEGIDQSDREFIERFAPEVHNNDIILSRSYPGIANIKEAIENISQFEIEGYLTHNELERSRNWVIGNFLTKNREAGTPQYITEQDISTYIDESVEYSIEYMSKAKMLSLST